MTADAGEAPYWALSLYVSGAGPRSAAAIELVRTLCDTELEGRFELAVYDAADHPDKVVRDRVLALPTLVRESPGPRRYIVGDLSDLDRLRDALDLTRPQPDATPGGATS